MQNAEYLIAGLICAAVAAWLIADNTATDDTELADLSTSPRGIRNNNPLNLKYISANPYNGQTGQDSDGFGIYSSWQLGVRAAGLQLTKDVQQQMTSTGVVTVVSLVNAWSTTDQTNYANYVANELGVTPGEPLVWPDDELNYVMAAIHFENGENPYSQADVQAALNS